MNILLTGSDGFVGSHLFYHLKEEHNVIGFDLKNGHDILKSEFPKDIDLVIHLAGLSGVRDSLDNPVDYWTNNVVATYRIFKQFKNGPKILYASSSTAREPWRNPYAMSKFYMETIAPHNALGMRFTTVYGPNAREQMLIPKILRDDVSYINVDHSRDFIHVEDILTAIGFLIVNKPPRKRKVIDVGTGVSHNLLDILSHLNIDVKDKRMGTMFERKDNKAQIGVLSEMGWMPKTNLIDYLKENYDN